MGSIGMGEILFLVILGLLIFGPDRLPEIARNIGKTIGALKREANSTLEELKRSADFDEFRSVADEMRGTGSQLRDDFRSITSSASLAAGAAGEPRTASSPEDLTPPYDPDVP